MQLRLAPLIALLALLLIALASTRAADSQRLYLPLLGVPAAVDAQAPIAPLPSATPSPSAAPDSTATPSATAAATSSVTPSATATATVTETVTFTATATITPSATATATVTETAATTPSVTPTTTTTPSATATATPSATPTLPPPVMIEGGTVSFWPEYAEHSMNGIDQVCTRYNDGAWRSTIPPDHFQPVGPLMYPNVGEVILINVATNARFTAPLIAQANGELVYLFSNPPPGDYRLFPYLFYKHPLDPAELPRRYSRIDTGTEVVSELRITIGAVQSIKWPDLQLRLLGEVCAY